MVNIINSGKCVLCNRATTNQADGKLRPFCAECEKVMNERAAASKVGSKHPNARIDFPFIPEGE